MRKSILCFCVCLLFACKNKGMTENEPPSFFGCASSPTLDVMVGSEGSILTSTHASLVWEKVSINEKSALLDVFYSASSTSDPSKRGKFYAVGHNGTVLISEDGLNWGAKNAPPEAHLFAVATHDNRIVAVGHRKMIYVSDDEGITWNEKNVVANKKTSLYDVAFGDASWLAVGDYGAVLVMNDSTTKVKENVVQLGISRTLKGIAFHNTLKRWVAVGHEGIIFISDDAGTTWEEVQSETKEDLLKVAFNGKRFVAVGTHGVILSSKDGKLWKKVQVNNNGTFRDVSSDENRWLLITIEGKKEVIEDSKME